MATTPIPYLVRIFYDVQGLDHVANVGVNPTSDPPLGMPFDEISIFNHDASSTYLDMFVDDLAAKMQPFYGTADGIGRAELWFRSGTGFAYDYLSTYVLDLAGTGGASEKANQVTFTSRTRNGGYGKFVLMETNFNADVVVRPPYSASIYKTLAEFIAKEDSYVLCRDNSFAYAPLGVAFGQNEALYRKRYR